MGIIYSPPFSIEDAISRGNDVYEILFAGWGVTDAPPSTNYANLQFPQPGQPGIPSSVAGIAIGSKSTVDRCWVSYNPGKRRTPSDPLQSENLLRMLSVESPLIFTQASNPNKYNTPGAVNDPVTTLADQGAFYIFPFADHPSAPPNNPITFPFPRRQDTTVLPPTYRDVTGVTRTFDFTALDQRGMPPFLHLQLYLKTPVLSPPSKRAPLMTQGSILVPLNSKDTQFLVAQIPTFGRRHVRVNVFGGAADWRIGALRAIGQVTGMIESPVATATTVAGTPYAFELGNHYADYTNLYVTPTTNAGSSMTFQVSAYD